MPNFSFDPNRGIQDPLGGDDQIRMRNADLMTRMSLENMARADRMQREAANAAAQERMFNMDRSDRAAMFNRQLDSTTEGRLAQERMFKEDLGFRKGEGEANRAQALTLFDKGEAAATNRFNLQETAADKRARQQREWSLEDRDYINPQAANQQRLIKSWQSPFKSAVDPAEMLAAGLGYMLSPEELKQAKLSQLRTNRQTEDEYAKEMGLPTSQETIEANKRKTELEKKVNVAKTEASSQAGDPALVSAIVNSPRAQQMMVAFKQAAESDDPVAIDQAAANIKNHFLSNGLPAFAADNFVSQLAKKYRPSGWEQFKSFMSYPVSRPFGGGRSSGEQTLDSMILETLQGNQ